MRKLLLGLAGAAVVACPLGAQTRVAEVYTVDQSHSLLDFTTRLVALNRVRGTFGAWEADFVYDPAAPTLGFVSFSAEVGSISTQTAERDSHLKTADFFDAPNHPRIRFEGRVVAARGTRFDVEGRLTIRDSTRTIRFPLELVAPEATDPWGNRRIVFAGQVRLNRRDYGIVGPRFWSGAIADSVTIEMELAGRIWRYKSLGFRPNAYYGPALLAAADSGRFEEVSRRLKTELAAEKDSLRLPNSNETGVLVGRLIQDGKLKEALGTLELFAQYTRRWDPPRRAGFETRRAEVLARLGRTADARRAIDAALAFDSTSTNARAWRASIGGAP